MPPSAPARVLVASAGLALLIGGLAGCGPRERRFDEERAFGHLVAQVELGPRAPGTPGHAAALE